uniref:Uncharacterized protein n=1 Tax=Anguilla anguilla TaxID=7936 RepID=A0A0E9R305_ANGAN
MLLKIEVVKHLCEKLFFKLGFWVSVDERHCMFLPGRLFP